MTQQQDHGLLTLVPPDIERYAMDHTTPLDPLLEELIEVTRERFGEQAQMLSGQIEGTLLQMLIASSGGRRILEIGTFTGFSAQMMAAALPAGGELITCDIDRKAIEVALSFFDRSPNGQKIELREGPALETMRTLTPGFDLVFIDADKEQYIAYYEEALRLLAPSGLIVVDNVLWSGRVLSPKDERDRAIVAFNAHVAADDRVSQVTSVISAARFGLIGCLLGPILSGARASRDGQTSRRRGDTWHSPRTRPAAYSEGERGEVMNQGTPSSSGDGASVRRRPRGAKEAPEQEAVLTKLAEPNGRAIVADELPPELKGRIKALIYDLSNDDLPMALLDLAHLYRALRMGSQRRSNFDEPIELTEDLRTLIFSDDRASIEEICMGPNEHDECPLTNGGHAVGCGGKWIMNKGWNFKVAPDAEACPLVSLGLAHRYLKAAIACKD